MADEFVIRRDFYFPEKATKGRFAGYNFWIVVTASYSYVYGPLFVAFYGLYPCNFNFKVFVIYFLLLQCYTNFYKSFSKNVLLYMSSRLSKIRSVHTYAMPRTVYFG